jgi:hypothetical protein
LPKDIGERTYDKGVDEELDEEDVAVALGGKGKGAENTAWPLGRIKGDFRSCSYLLESCNLLMILPHKDQAGHKGTKDLSKYIVGHFLEGKALPHSQSNRDGRIEMTTTGGSATKEKSALVGDRGKRNTHGDGKGNPNSVCPTNLENGSKLLTR